jgi:hypothetical protein
LRPAEGGGHLAWLGSIPLGLLPPARYSIVGRARQGAATTEQRLAFEIVAPRVTALGGGRPHATHAPELAELLRRAGRYVAGYKESFRDLVAEEVYEQRIGPCPLITTRADILFVAFGGPFEWGSFRDVFEMNGKPVRHREGRLERLFMQDHGSALAQARAIRAESARFNVGARRTINEPTLPLCFLLPANQPRFAFEVGKRRAVAGRERVELRFREEGRPTMVSTERGKDLPSRGRFWIDFADGTVTKCELEFPMMGGSSARVAVDYAPEKGLDIWVPSEMRESYGEISWDDRCPGRMQATARYSRFKRITVDTQEVYRLQEAR